MEQQLFTWKDWEEIDVAHYSFSNCILIQQIGNHPPGTRFEIITIDYQNGILVLFNQEHKPEKYQLKLCVKHILN